jgi:hypothetical protein
MENATNPCVLLKKIVVSSGIGIPLKARSTKARSKVANVQSE